MSADAFAMSARAVSVRLQTDWDRRNQTVSEIVKSLQKNQGDVKINVDCVNVQLMLYSLLQKRDDCFEWIL